MQAIWRGAISFGVIIIPVRLYGATEEKSLRFNMLHASDGGRVRFNRTCAECGKDNLTKDDLVRAFEYEKGSYVTFDETELDAVQVPTSNTVEILQFVPGEQIDPIYYNRSYYLAPEGLGTKAYGLLRDALVESGKVAVAKVAIRDKERLATLRVRENAIVLETMYWPDEIREAAFPELSASPDVNPRELQMAQTLIDTLTEDFDPSQHSDSYREALLAAVEQKVQGREVVAPAASPEQAPVADLMEALERSLEEVRERRSKAQ
ncbi:MAG TPA: Ku protein [Actinomycetota bacterium]|nr:Ku protein [Actinomycetota bacterium]